MKKTSRTKDAVSWQSSLPIISHEKRFGFCKADSSSSLLDLQIRVGLLWAILLAISGAVVSRLIYLQIFEGDRNLLIAQSNRLTVDRERAPRGVIYDCKNRVMVRNVPDDEYGINRQYVLGSAGAHLLGYVAEVTEEELGCYEGLCYELGALRGRSGVEASFEPVLRGRDGGKIVEVDSLGNEIRVIGEHEPETGEDVHLSVDLDLQNIMYLAMEGKSGAAVALDMQGRVLGLVSSPSYDPNLFTIREDSGILQNLLSDSEKKYFLNRVMGGSYPPGSVFKLVTAYAGLEEGAITSDTEFEDTGEIKIGDEYRYGNWYFDQYGRTEGFIDVVGALKRSNDIFFYKTGEEIGVEGLVVWAERFGFGERTGIEVGGEVEGLVPNPLWKERYIGEKWFLGNTYHMSIGQGDLLTTPLQVARMTVAVLSGRLCDVSILYGEQVFCRDLGLTSEHIGVVWEGMRQACQEGGTAYPLFDFNPYVVCKTGTAQHGGEEDEPHAWITVGYPGENPEIVITVILESAGEGSLEAGPVVRQILDEWEKI